MFYFIRFIVRNTQLHIIMLILSLFLLHVLSGSFCYDVELEGSVKIGKHFLNTLRQPSKLLEVVAKYLSKNFEGKGTLPRALAPMPMVMRASTNTSAENLEYKKTDPLEQLMTHLQTKAKMTLNNLGTQIITHLKITKNITPILDVITNDFAVTMQNYYDFFKKSQNEYERDLIYLDMAETSSKLLHNEAKKLMNDIFMHDNQNPLTAHQYDTFQNMTKNLLELSHKHKKEAFQYICDTYKVCRQYPAFTDFCINLIKEILLLEDYKFLAVLDTLIKILNLNEKILARIAEAEDRALIMAKLKGFSSDLLAARASLTAALSILTQRYKTISSGAEFKMRSKATRIILDIIDKALSREDSNILAIDFDNSIHVIRHWSILKRNEVDKNLEELAKSLLRKLQHNMTKNARKELKVLIRSIMREDTQDDEVYQRLFKFGSKYVKGEDFHFDVEIM